MGHLAPDDVRESFQLPWLFNALRRSLTGFLQADFPIDVLQMGIFLI
jgi:hypothetical protein